MGNSINLHLELQSSLEKNLKQSKKEMTSFNSVLEKSSKNFDSINKNTNSINKNYDKLIKKQKSSLTQSKLFEKSLKGISSIASYAAAPLLMMFSASGVYEAAKAVGKYNQTLTHLTHRMGESAKSAMFLQDQIYKVSLRTGAATEQTLEFIVSLKKYRVANKDINKMATTMTYFQKVTGTSIETTKRLTGELMLVGRMSAKSTAKMLSNMAKVQSVIGMTNEDMESLSEGIITSTKSLHQMGKSANFITSFNTGLTKLAGGFASVGMSAKDATDLVNDLLNPDRIEDNALLYSKLGISMADAVSGNIDMNQVQSGLLDIANQMDKMDNVSANQLAKSMGKSLSYFRQLKDAKFDEAGNAMLGSEDGTTELEKQKKSMMTMMDKIEEGFNKVQTIFQTVIFKLKSFLKPALIVGMILLAIKGISLMRKKMLSLGTDYSNTIVSGVSGGMEMAAKKRGIIASKAKDLGGSYLSNREQRVKGSEGFSNTNAKADFFDEQASRDLSPAIKKMTKGTADMLRNLSGMSAPASLLTQKTLENNKYIKDRLFMAKEEEVKAKSIMDVRINDIKNQRKAAIDRLYELKKFGRTNDLSAEQTREISKLDIKSKKIKAEYVDLEQKSYNTATNYANLQKGLMKKLGKEELGNMYKKSRMSLEMLKQEKEGVLNKKKDLEIERDIVSNQIEKFEKQKKSGDLNSKDLMIMNDLKKKQIEWNDEINKTNNQYDELTRESEKELGIMKDIKKASGNKSGSEIEINAGSTNKSLLGKTGDLMSSSLNKAGAKISESFVKFKESSKMFVDNVKERMSPKNIAAGIGKGMAKTGKAILNSGKQMAKAGASMLVMGIVMKALQPVISALKPVFMDLVDKLMPIFFKILKALFPIFAILVNTLLPPMLKILGFLLKSIGGLSKSLMEMPIRIKYAIKPFMSKEDKEKGIKEDIAKMSSSNLVYKTFDSLSAAGQDIIDTAKTLGQVVDPHMLDNLEYKSGNRSPDANSPSGDNYAATLRATGSGIAVESAAGTNPAKTTASNTAATVTELSKVEENTSVMAQELKETKEINIKLIDVLNNLSSKIDNMSGGRIGSYTHGL